MSGFKYKGQRYERVDTVTHVKLDGTAMPLQVWRSHCATCGEEFEFMTTTRRHNLRWPRRRCQEHRRPGVRV
jgi:hypothetical protein